MDKDIAAFITSTGVTVSVLFLSVLGQVMIQAKRHSKKHYDFVFPHDLSLLGISITLGLLMVYQHIPNICPLAQSGSLEWGYVSAGLVSSEFFLFIASSLLVGHIQGREYENRSPAAFWRSWRFFYRNAPGFLALLLVSLVVLVGR